MPTDRKSAPAPRLALLGLLALLALASPASAMPGQPVSLSSACAGEWGQVKSAAEASGSACAGAVEAGVAEVNARSNSVSALVPLEVLGGSQQVVSGILYSVLVKVAPSSCPNDGSACDAAAEVDASAAQLWYLRVSSQPWLSPPFTVLSVQQEDAAGAAAVLAGIASSAEATGEEAEAAVLSPTANAAIGVVGVAVFVGGMAVAVRATRRRRYEQL